MPFPLQVGTPARVISAQIRGCLNNGPEWDTTLAGTTSTGTITGTTTNSLTALTDSSGGTASNAIAAIADTATKNAVASLTAKVNLLLAMVRNLNA